MNRFYLLWLYAITLIALALASVHSMTEEDRLVAETVARSSALAVSIEDSIADNVESGRTDKITRTVNRLRQQDRLTGLVICPLNSNGTRAPLSFPRGSGWESFCQDSHVAKATSKSETTWRLRTTSGAELQLTAHRMNSSDGSIMLLLVQDLAFLKEQWLDSFLRSMILSWLGGALLLLLVATQLRTWMKTNVRVVQKTIRSLLAGRKPPWSTADKDRLSTDLKPITEDMDKLAAKILSLSDRRAPKVENSGWLASLRTSMQGKSLVVVANREPYIHQRNRGKIEVVRPASGLVTALEPILRQCGGLWVAHGSGTADRETVDANNEVAVPPDDPTYRLKRLWLTPEQEAGYYYGFSNEGIWPLCHLAHTRPTFRLSDWNHYRDVNEAFAAAMPETSLGPESIILVQDYHFALLPRLIQQRIAGREGAKVGLFWHIPWPNPEAFGICPWYTELLRGMLGADLIGFHTQYHCNNFLETCNRYLEARVDMENFSVTMENHQTRVRAFPIGIDTAPVRTLSDEERTTLKAHYGIHAEIVAVGVDRLDYTKGLVERVQAVERFLEKHPEYVGRFSFVQMGSPSRTHIPAYRNLVTQLTQEVDRVNARFTTHRLQRQGYRPIILLPQHHDWAEIRYFYQIGDLCLVTSLHDGMNLVAKEYVWCQRPDRGALVLSKFAGASREMTEAFIVNPYSIEEMADAMASAIAMAPEERTRRMSALREKVSSHNAYHWAADLVSALVPPQHREQSIPAVEPVVGPTPVADATKAVMLPVLVSKDSKTTKAGPLVS